jgi:hypothetical protein
VRAAAPGVPSGVLRCRSMEPMAGETQFGPAPDFGARGWRATTPQTLRDDPVALREAMKAVRVQGAALPRSDEGLGRRAAVLVPVGMMGELDGRALADALEAGGWTTRHVGLDQDAAAVCDEVLAARVEALLVPVADAAQVLASQHALSLIRRLNAPPLVVGVTFSVAEGAASVGADHVVEDVDALAPLLRRRLGGSEAAVPWGVRLHREDETLVVAPFGLLDPTTVSRLREVVETRRARYPHILIDLRELDALSTSGMTALTSWPAETPWPPTVSALPDPRTLQALSLAGLTGTLPFTEP